MFVFISPDAEVNFETIHSRITNEKTFILNVMCQLILAMTIIMHLQFKKEIEYHYANSWLYFQ